MSRPNLRNKRPEENDDFVASLGAAGGGHAYELNLAGNFANRMHFCTRYLCFFSPCCQRVDGGAEDMSQRTCPEDMFLLTKLYQKQFIKIRTTLRISHGHVCWCTEHQRRSCEIRACSGISSSYAKKQDKQVGLVHLRSDSKRTMEIESYAATTELPNHNHTDIRTFVA